MQLTILPKRILITRYTEKHKSSTTMEGSVDQRTDGPVNAHLISWPMISIWCPQRSREPDIPSFTHLVKYINQFQGHMLQLFPKIPTLSQFSI